MRFRQRNSNMSVSDDIREVLWMRMSILNIDINKPTLLFKDNQSCIKLASNPEYHKHIKHVDIKHHFIQGKDQEGTMQSK